MSDSNKYRALKDYHLKQAKHRSRYTFIKWCIENNLTPSGLKLRLQPQVTETSNKCELIRKWTRVLHGTSRTLLQSLKSRYREMKKKNFTYFCRYRSTKTTLKVYFPKLFFQEIWAVLKAYFKTLPVWTGLYWVMYMGEQLLMYLEHLCGKACVKWCCCAWSCYGLNSNWAQLAVVQLADMGCIYMAFLKIPC